MAESSGTDTEETVIPEGDRDPCFQYRYWVTAVPGILVDTYLCLQLWYLHNVKWVWAIFVVFRVLIVCCLLDFLNNPKLSGAWVVFLKLTPTGIYYGLIMYYFPQHCSWSESDAKDHLPGFREFEINCADNTSPFEWFNMDPPERLALIAELFTPVYAFLIASYLPKVSGVNLLWQQLLSDRDMKDELKGLSFDIFVDMLDIMNFMTMFFDGEVFYLLTKVKTWMLPTMIATFLVSYVLVAASGFMFAWAHKDGVAQDNEDEVCVANGMRVLNAFRSGLFLELPMLMWRGFLWNCGFEVVSRVFLVKNGVCFISDMIIILSCGICTPLVDLLFSVIAACMPDLSGGEEEA